MKKSQQAKMCLSLEDTRQILNGFGLGPSGIPLGDLWVTKCEELRALEEVVSDYLLHGNGPALAARGLSRSLTKRGGHLVVQVRVDGRLHLSFLRGPSSIPPMKELRKRASLLGVDISAFGVRRKEIHTLLEQESNRRTSKAEAEAKPSGIQPDQTLQYPLASKVLESMRTPLLIDKL